MCLAIPFQLVQIEGNNAIGEAAGVQRKIRVDFIREPQVGDYVIVHAGFAIEMCIRDSLQVVHLPGRL